MHPTKTPRCIYGENTPEQCCLGRCKVSDGTSTQVVDGAINRWRAKITCRELYNVRDRPKKGGGKSIGKTL